MTDNLAQNFIRRAELHKQADREIDQMLHGAPQEVLLAAKLYRKLVHVLIDAESENYDATEFTKLIAEQMGNCVMQTVVKVSRNGQHAAEMAQAMILVTAKRAAELIKEHYDAPTPSQTSH